MICLLILYAAKFIFGFHYILMAFSISLSILILGTILLIFFPITIFCIIRAVRQYQRMRAWRQTTHELDLVRDLMIDQQNLPDRERLEYIDQDRLVERLEEIRRRIEEIHQRMEENRGMEEGVLDNIPRREYDEEDEFLSQN
jgi:ABC-type multidrug transport system fused ATPase/permease subunit